MADETYAVMQTRLERIEPEVLEQALIIGGKLPKADASRAARRCRGFIVQRMPRAAADAIAQLLNAAGYAVRALPMAQLAELGKPVAVSWLRIDDVSLGIPMGGQQVLFDVPWSSVFVVNAGHLSVLEQKSREVGTVDARGNPTVETKITPRSERHPALEIVALSAAGKLIYARLLSLRMQGQKMPGVPLDLPRRLQFFVVLDELVKRTTSAFVSPETRKMLVDRKADQSRADGSLQFEADERAFTDYSRWLLQLVMYREASQGAP